MTLSEIFEMFGTPFDANNDPFFDQLNKECDEFEDHYDLENDVNSSEWFEDR